MNIPDLTSFLLDNITERTSEMLDTMIKYPYGTYHSKDKILAKITQMYDKYSWPLCNCCCRTVIPY